jgi:hypothetical protein
MERRKVGIGGNADAEIIRDTPADQTVEFSVDERNDCGGYSLHQLK